MCEGRHHSGAGQDLLLVPPIIVRADLDVCCLCDRYEGYWNVPSKPCVSLTEGMNLGVQQQLPRPRHPGGTNARSEASVLSDPRMNRRQQSHPSDLVCLRQR